MFCQDPRISWKTKVSEALGWPYQLLGTGPDQLLLTQPFPLPSYLCTVASMHNNLSWGHQTVSLHPPIWTHLGCCSTLSTGNMYTGLHPPPFIPHLSPKAILPSPPFPSRMSIVHSGPWLSQKHKTPVTTSTCFPLLQNSSAKQRLVASLLLWAREEGQTQEHTLRFLGQWIVWR